MTYFNHPFFSTTNVFISSRAILCISALDVCILHYKLSLFIIGKGRNSSVPTEVAMAAVTVAVMSVVVMLFRTSKTTLAAAIVVVGLLLVLWAFWWNGYNTGTFRSHLQDPSLSLKLIKT